MTEKLRPIRRVVTGNDGQGRSCVLFDSAAPNVNPGAVGASAAMTDIWVFHSCPAVVSGERDDGNLPFQFEPPETTARSEEHTSELQSPCNLVCRLLLEKKKTTSDVDSVVEQS